VKLRINLINLRLTKPSPMKTSKILLASIMLVILISASGFSQTGSRKGLFHKNEITLGYTAGSILSVGNVMENLLWDVIIQPIDPLVSSSAISWGGISAGYQHSLTRHVSLGGTFGFSQDLLKETRKSTGDWEYSSNFLTLMATIKVNIVATEWFDLYARADLGGTLILGVSENAGIRSDYSGYIFAGQFSPVGIRVGKGFSFFAEAGFGTLGIVNAGFNIRF